MVTFEDFESEAEREEREASQSGKFQAPTVTDWESIEEDISEATRASEPFWK